MSPAPLNEAVRSQMSRMPKGNTKPELDLRRELHARGLRYRLHSGSLPGRPDIVFTRARIAVFVDGCFWHLCPEHCVMPKNNAPWWQEKLEANVKRDRKKDDLLTGAGWLPIHVWEHERPSVAADLIQTAWRERIHSSARLLGS